MHAVCIISDAEGNKLIKKRGIFNLFDAIQMDTTRQRKLHPLARLGVHAFLNLVQESMLRY